MIGQSRNVGAIDPGVELHLLAAIERDSNVTQRALARELGIALGLTNAYLRCCVRKGLVKMREAPLRRYAYYLTPQGLSEKSRLTAEYLSVSLGFFRRARCECAVLFRHCEAQGWCRVALYGAGELAEISLLSAGDSNVEVVCVIDAEEAGRCCAGVPVVANLAAAQTVSGRRSLDGLVLTDTRHPQASFDRLSALILQNGMTSLSIAAPPLLGISQTRIASQARIDERERTSV